VHLAQLLLELGAADEALPQALYRSLEERYRGYERAGKLA